MPTSIARKQADGEAPETEWLSIGQAARALGIAYVTVLTRVAQGQLDKIEFNGRIYVSRASVDRALQSA